MKSSKTRFWTLALVCTALLLLIVAGCEGEPTPTPTPPPTSTPIPTLTPTATNNRTWIRELFALGSGTAPIASTPVPTPTPTTTPDPSSHLLEKLARIPASFKGDGVWFGDLGRALEIAGIQSPHNLEELRALPKDERDAYLKASRGIVLAPGFLGGVYGEPEWEQVFGFNEFDVSLAVSTGEVSSRPLQVAYLEGEFDEDGIKQRLQDLGYEEKVASGKAYYSIRDDYQWGSLVRPDGFAVGLMNRVYVSSDVLIAAPATDMVTDILAAWAGETPSLADDPAFSSLAIALGDPLSAGLLTREATLNPEVGGVADALLEYARPADWGTLHEWEALGAGYSWDESGSWWSISLFYSDPDAADADSQELIQRMQGYDTALTELVERGWPQQPIDQVCTQLIPEIQRHLEGSTLSIHCTMGEEGPTALTLLEMRDLGFLLP